jgi:hypothetical protein
MTDFDIDDHENSDWTKRTWDLWVGRKLVSTADELLEFLNLATGLPGFRIVANPYQQKLALRKFFHTPAGKACPRAIVRELKSRGLK